MKKIMYTLQKVRFFFSVYIVGEENPITIDVKLIFGKIVLVSGWSGLYYFSLSDNSII